MTSLDAGLSLLAAASPPAGGASVKDLAIGVGMLTIVSSIVVAVGLGHRSGRIGILGWFERFSERVSGQPGWASMPCGLAILALFAALFGVYWDVALHLDIGRDEGPFGTPAHYFILAGLFGLVMAGFFAMVLPAKREGPTFVKITRTWHAPLGGVLILAAATFSLIGFPLDDQWHRLFGQDVTLWGPTHLMLVGGASMALLGIAVLQVEVVRVMRRTGQIKTERMWVKMLRNVWLPGGLLIALSTFQMEFDLGMPQFALIFQPMLIMLAAGVVLVAARVWLGKGAAFGAVAFFLVMRGLLALGVGGLGESVAHFPLYIVEAALVEGLALVVSVKRPLRFGAWCGLALGTIGLAAEWGWSHIWMPIPWPAEILPEVVALGLAMALAASLIGAWMGARLNADRMPDLRWLRTAGLAGAVAVTAMIAYGLYTPSDGSSVSASVALRDVTSGPERTAIVTAKLQPADSAENATWLTASAWQGGSVVVDRLRRIGPGTYQSTKPIPVHGEYKTLLRLHSGNSLTGVPIYAPADDAIPVPAIAAPPTFERAFVSDHKLLQREAKTKDPAVTYGAYAVIGFCTLVLLAMLSWGLHRVRLTADGGQTPAPGSRKSQMLATPPAA